jgi:hypothetical protein
MPETLSTAAWFLKSSVHIVINCKHSEFSGAAANEKTVGE